MGHPMWIPHLFMLWLMKVAVISSERWKEQYFVTVKALENNLDKRNLRQIKV